MLLLSSFKVPCFHEITNDRQGSIKKTTSRKKNKLPSLKVSIMNKKYSASLKLLKKDQKIHKNSRNLIISVEIENNVGSNYALLMFKQ